MRNKGAIRLLAIVFALVSLYQLTFTYVTKKVEKDARLFGAGDVKQEQAYLDSIRGENVYSFLGLKGYTYKECKELEMNLGLDLKGGMNVTMEVSVVDIIKAMANNSKNETFVAAIAKAKEMQANSQDDFVTLFGKAFSEIDPNAQLSSPDIFGTLELKDKIAFGATNSEVLKVLKTESEAAIDNTFNILRSRIDRFGVSQPNIQKADVSGRIIIELPGIKDAARVRKLLQGTASLEFWETYTYSEVGGALNAVNTKLAEINAASETTDEAPEVKEEVKANDDVALLDKIEGESQDSLTNAKELAKTYPLFSVLNPNQGKGGSSLAVVGYSHVKDTAQVNKIFAMPAVKSVLPRNLKFYWGVKAINDGGTIFELYAIKVTSRDGKAPLDGDAVISAHDEIDQRTASAEVSMSMNGEGSKVWARLTKDNLQKSIAIVLDGYVYSAPTVQSEIKGGSSSISGNFTIAEAKDLANILKSGKLPAPAHIIADEVVGPSLGQESIQKGMWSFIIAFIMILVYMFFFYSKGAGLTANIALITNLFFLFGVLASIGAVLTLPGIAGIVLTIGMSVDANVLIFERIQEEMKSGKGLSLAISDGYKNAYSAIIDGNLTTLLTGVILYIFGEGPIKGFATTLVIGIISSLFAAIFITRLFFEGRLARKKNITFTTKLTDNWLRNAHIGFIEKRKVFYVISGALIIASIISLSTRGLNQGIDFTGGRTYVVAFDQPVEVGDVAESLSAVYGHAPEVKTFGGNSQVKISTKYKIDQEGTEIDDEVEAKLFEGLKDYLPAGTTKESFLENNRKMSQKVGPTIADDIRQSAVWSVLFALIVIFLYIMIRFSNWQYGLGAVAALAHDTIIVLGIFSIFYGILPFSLEIDQAFIAAILTVVGYSINDTVVVFDRIREYLGLQPKRNPEEVIDKALNSTLRRTFSTSLSTLVVLLAIFFFGGTSIQGFTFALIVGVVVGTYSSLFIATPIAYDSKLRVQKVIAKKH
ncbi:protein translocase subunit SecDF [Ancylomarina sp. 16SWW S1-10-2]|uniref:protein translocase subunit SecDF n=1 Tax=Ancylomarina sp. 16SWW S1-10-2 TaxID=2499681 RepID=UPI0012AD237F|nr:protein translocase subunit SecDF [Ancylomarina sp. 16SWW S1-10-2]MRT94645.1 protein translocase subunit SecDF [Ancylomarina sp. 16SWW S1-10-2]